MFYGCPFCNGIGSPGLCPQCGNKLQDLGMVEDFYGPYSPYENDKILEWDDQKNNEQTFKCKHLVYCPNCQYDCYLTVTCSDH